MLLAKMSDRYDEKKNIVSDTIAEGFMQMEKLIKEQPTAYDIDKVVEELELNSFEFGTDTLPAHYVRLNDAIEIVKQGMR